MAARSPDAAISVSGTSSEAIVLFASMPRMRDGAESTATPSTG